VEAFVENVVASGEATLNPLRGKALATKVGPFIFRTGVELNNVLFVASCTEGAIQPPGASVSLKSQEMS